MIRGYICLETKLHGGVKSELKKGRSRLSDDEIADILTKTEQKKCTNTQ